MATVDSYVALGLKFNGNCTNVGNASMTFTPKDGISYSDTIKMFGTHSIRVDDSVTGTVQNVLVSDVTGLDFGTDDFTIRFWYKWSGASGGERHIIGGGNIAYSIQIRHFTTDNALFFNVPYKGAKQYTVVLDTDWHYYCFVRNSGTLKFYRDGVQVGADWSLTESLTLNGGFVIGSIRDTGDISTSIRGYLDDFAIDVGIARSGNVPV